MSMFEFAICKMVTKIDFVQYYFDLRPVMIWLVLCSNPLVFRKWWNTNYKWRIFPIQENEELYYFFNKTYLITLFVSNTICQMQ